MTKLFEPSISCFFLMICCFPNWSEATGPQGDLAKSGDEKWSVEIVRGFSQEFEYAVLRITVKESDEGEVKTYDSQLYQKKFDKSRVQNLKTMCSLFSDHQAWAKDADILGDQIVELAKIKVQFENQLREIVQSQIAEDENASDGMPLSLSPKQIENIANEISQLEFATELVALNSLLPHQKRVIFEQHFSVQGLKALSSVYGAAALGLNAMQMEKLKVLTDELENEKNEAVTSAQLRKKEIERKLWESILSELTEEQKEQLNRFKELYLLRLKEAGDKSKNEEYSLGGIDFRVVSRKSVVVQDVVIEEPCSLFCSSDKFQKTVKEVMLFDHSLAGFAMDKLPVIGTSRYLRGIKFSKEELALAHAARDEFLHEVASYILYSRDESLRPAGTFDFFSKPAIQIAYDAEIQKQNKKFSAKFYTVLNEDQKKMVLENRMGFELFRKGAVAFKSKVFCNELNISEDQRKVIEGIISRTEEEIGAVQRAMEEKNTEIELATERKLEEVVDKTQLRILNEIR